jgi:hypothetical protein
MRGWFVRNIKNKYVRHSIFKKVRLNVRKNMTNASGVMDVMVLLKKIYHYVPYSYNTRVKRYSK